MDTPTGHFKTDSFASLELTLGKLFMEFPVNEGTETAPDSDTEGGREHRSSLATMADAEGKDRAQPFLSGRPGKTHNEEIETKPNAHRDSRESAARDFESHGDGEGAEEILETKLRGQPSAVRKEEEGVSACVRIHPWDDPTEWIDSLEDVAMRDSIFEFVRDGRLDCEEWMWNFMRAPPQLSKPSGQRSGRQKSVLTDMNRRRDPASRARNERRRRASECVGAPLASRSPFAKMQAAASPCFVSTPTHAPWIERFAPDFSFPGHSTSPERTPDRSERRDSGSQEEVDSSCDWAKMLKTPIRARIHQSAKKRFRIEDDSFSHRITWPSPKRKRWSSGRCSPTNSAQLWSEESLGNLKNGLARTRSCGLTT